MKNPTYLSHSVSATLFKLSCVVFIILSLSPEVTAQSTDIERPTPISANEIQGTIAALDIGDPRLTKHYYMVMGTPGDLSMTIESRNLNGDLDVFTLAGLRPLLKISMYASGEDATSSSKSIYLRRRETLLLRVEARSANDNEGSYRIKLEGSFEPIASGATTEESTTQASAATTQTRDKNVRRVSSVGGRIAEERTETTTEASVTTTQPTEAETTTRANPPPPSVPPPPSRPNTRARRPSTRTPSTSRRRNQTSTTTTAKRERTPAKPAETTTAETTTTTTQTETSAQQTETGPKLIIETRDGMKVERYMSTVRRVTVENNQIVVVLKNGRIERLPFSSVVRMSIEP